ncbi:MAG: hypothetical protein R6V01_05940, partial [Thermoplasmatota archaeon]
GYEEVYGSIDTFNYILIDWTLKEIKDRSGVKKRRVQGTLEEYHDNISLRTELVELNNSEVVIIKKFNKPLVAILKDDNSEEMALRIKKNITELFENIEDYPFYRYYIERNEKILELEKIRDKIEVGFIRTMRLI